MENNNNDKGMTQDRKTIGRGYLVLNISDIRELLRTAKDKSKRENDGKILGRQTIIIESDLIQFTDDKDIQFTSCFKEVY